MLIKSTAEAKQENQLLGLHVGKFFRYYTAQIDAQPVNDFLGQVRMRWAAEDFNVRHVSAKKVRTVLKTGGKLWSELVSE